jgi:phosphonopyruvate decarboxylase
MVSPHKYFDLLNGNGIEFFVGVPDSSLKNFTSYIADYVSKEKNIIAANEGACIGLASGYHLATGKTPFVYMQNSGIGNAINPLLSLADEKVYQIPMILMIGWRGEPGVKDEPQHLKQGKITLALLECMGIPYIVLDADEETAIEQTNKIIKDAKEKSTPHAIVARPSVFEKYKLKTKIPSNYNMSRETALKLVIDSLDDKDIIVSTTGKLSRELFEYREELNQTHEKDFLTVGSMGHSSAIALGIALQKKERKVFCLDGDGSILMHTGTLATIGTLAPKNFFHIIFNNGAHESVGGQPTVGFEVDFAEVASGYQYKSVVSVDTKEDLSNVLSELNDTTGPFLLEVRVSINSREDLGRPTISPVDNKKNFTKNLK